MKSVIKIIYPINYDFLSCFEIEIEIKNTLFLKLEE